MCRLNKKKLAFQIEAIGQDILDNVISPICEIGPGIWADFFLADIRTYSMGDKEKEERILNEICRRYGIESLKKDGAHFIIEITEDTNDEFESPIDSYWTLASIALYIILYGKRTNFYMIEKCDFCDKQGSLICGPYDNLICLNCADKFKKEEIQ